MTGSKKWVAATVAIAMDSPEWQIGSGTGYEYNGIKGKEPALMRIDDIHHLLAYKGPDDDGWATVLMVDTDNWTITQGVPTEFDIASAKRPAFGQIDSSHYLCVYSSDRGGSSNDEGWATVLTVNNSTWDITNNTPYQYEPIRGKEAALAKIDGTSFLCAYEGEIISKSEAPGWATIMTVDTGTWTVSAGTPFQYEAVKGKQPALVEISGSMYLCAYPGPNDDGYAVVIDSGILRP